MAKRNTYSRDSLVRLLERLEQAYDMGSGEFFLRHRTDRVPSSVSGYDRHVWAVTYADWLRMSRSQASESVDEFSSHGVQTLALSGRA
jgi:hypothetical protein